VNEMAVGALVESEIRSLRRRLSGILHNPSDVDDVIQDTCVRVLEYSAECDDIKNPVAFLHRVARNLAIDRLRWRRRTSRICAGQDDSEDIRRQLQNASSHDVSADELLQRGQALQSVMDVMAQLPPKCQQAYVLSQLEERTYREISDQVGLSVSMIEKYVLRARRHITSRLQPARALALL
jgi:RNA polymerase sigma factor (sigma-70 family)